MPAVSTRRFAQLLGGVVPAQFTPTLGATTNITARVTAASLITASPGATATVTAPVAVVEGFSATIGATTNVAGSVTAPSRISATIGARSSVTTVIVAPGPVPFTASIGVTASMGAFSSTGGGGGAPITTPPVATVQYLIAAVRVDQPNGALAGAGTAMNFPHALVHDFEGVQRNFEQFAQPGLFVGSGAPKFPAQAGNFYHRTDTPTIANQRIYVYDGTTWEGIA